jgi:hypothetical protein
VVGSRSLAATASKQASSGNRSLRSLALPASRVEGESVQEGVGRTRQPPCVLCNRRPLNSWAVGRSTEELAGPGTSHKGGKAVEVDEREGEENGRGCEGEKKEGGCRIIKRNEILQETGIWEGARSDRTGFDSLGNGDGSSV